eukprot:scaffold333558_cov106-Cyclotella_meneghiniana.AAC.1
MLVSVLDANAIFEEHSPGFLLYCSIELTGAASLGAPEISPYKTNSTGRGSSQSGERPDTISRGPIRWYKGLFLSPVFSSFHSISLFQQASASTMVTETKQFNIRSLQNTTKTITISIHQSA